MSTRGIRLALVGVLAAAAVATGAGRHQRRRIRSQGHHHHHAGQRLHATSAVRAPPTTTTARWSTRTSRRTRSSSPASSTRTASRSITPSSSSSLRARWRRPMPPTRVARDGPASARPRCPAPVWPRSGQTPWLTAWAPGHGEDILPAGTGVKFPAGSLVIMQIHYNLLRGDKPVQAKLTLHTVPSSTPLKPLSLDLMPAPPDIPCPAGVTGPLCNRTASLVDLGQRFGAGPGGLRRLPRAFCGRSVTDPPAGDTTSCTWPVHGGPGASSAWGSTCTCSAGACRSCSTRARPGPRRCSTSPTTTSTTSGRTR